MPPSQAWNGVPGVTRRAVFISLILAAMVSVPYLFPAPLSISRSYVAGFSNRAAILILFLGTGLFAVYTKGRVGRWETQDSRLGWPALGVALVVTLLKCLRSSGLRHMELPGPEAIYAANRLQLLAAGKAPYRDFEFVYGPLLLYPVVWIKAIFHLSMVRAYDIVWLGFWLVGVTFIWIVVRRADFPVPSRPAAFALLVAAQLVWAGYGGLSYTPLRAYFAACCIVVTHGLWRRFGNLWLTVAVALVCVSLAICCSMDQAVGATIGLSTLIGLLALSLRKPSAWGALAAFVLGLGVSFGWAHHTGLTIPLLSFGGGGYSYPLLPSLPIFVALFVYVVAGCALYRALVAQFSKHPEGIDTRLRNSVVVPLVLAGCSMIPNALGRCDILHIGAAVPAFAVGILVICAMPGIRRWYLPAAWIGLVLFPIVFPSLLRKTKIVPMDTPDPKLVAQGYLRRMGDDQWYESSSLLTARELPCDTQYFSPSFMPHPLEPFLPTCLDTGYYDGFTDVITPGAIASKVRELKDRPRQPLLMENLPLEAQLPLQLARMGDLYYESETLWAPPVRNAPLTYAPIIDYIRSHYTEGPPISNGKLRVWYPVQTQTSGQ